MTRDYFCPRCRAHLNPNVKIVLSMRRGDSSGLALLDPQPGNYQLLLSRDFALRDGDEVEVRCPVCAATLESPASAKLARVAFEFEDGSRGFVDFARTIGLHATYVLTEQRVQSFGENAEVFGGLNFFGAGQELE